jgi:propanol-preferring alcohol dehydrogenase
LDARYCSNRSMCGITGSDGAFAEYMITPHSSLVRLPAGLSFEQAAPLMCAGVRLPSRASEIDVVVG